LRIERVHERRDDQRVLVPKDAEDRTLGDARGLRDLFRADVEPVFAQQRDRRGDERGAAVLRRHRRDAPPALAPIGSHAAILLSERSLSH
jgi:hypothetical protein